MVTAIDIAQLEISYKAKRGERVQAVRGLSLQVAAGEVVGFLGPNGAGKSSTLKALMGFIFPDHGECRIFGHLAGTLEAKRCIGYLPEVAMYYPFLNPLETLELYGQLQGLSGKALRQESLELLELLGLSKALKKQNRQLSKGMLQRVGIAQALLGNPALLILDEVTSGLDPVGRRELRQILKERQRQGTTLFFSSHELSEVEMLCDRILVLDKGRLIESRDVQPLKESLRTFQVCYQGSTNLLGHAQSVQSCEGETVATFENARQLIEAMEILRSDGSRITNVVAQEGSLEDYFVETVTKEAA